MVDKVLINEIKVETINF